MNEGHFYRVTKQSLTRLWINNPTPEDADKAIAAGAISCTTNPIYCMKLLLREEEHNYVSSVVDEVIKKADDDDAAADLIGGV